MSVPTFEYIPCRSFGKEVAKLDSGMAE
jgi:hypothetical protein